jgi:hypothetical protein
MPTTVQQIESLPEGLITLDAVNIKTPLVEPITEKPAEEPQAPAVVVAEVVTTKTIKHDLFETPKHVIPCSDKFAKLTMEVNILKEEVSSAQRCFILTVHDYGFDNHQFDEFINSPHMSAIKCRSVWLNLTLPGQEVEASDLAITNYPTLEELADELVTALDFFELPQVVLLGEGIGATICAQFAFKYPNRVYGLMCIEPIVSQASYMESIKYKLSNFSFRRQESKECKDVKKELEITGDVPETEKDSLQLQPIDTTVHEKFKHRNSKNLSLLHISLVNRTNLVDIVAKLHCDTLVATNKNGPGWSESKRFYRALNVANQADFKKLVNSPFIEIDDAETDRLLDSASMDFALGVQYFLQGIGLLSAMPLRGSFSRQGSVVSQINEVVSPIAVEPVVE